MLNSAEHEICPANKSQITNICKFFLSKYSLKHEKFSANKYENDDYCWHFHIYQQRNFRTRLSWAWKKFYNLRAWICFGSLGTQRVPCKDWKDWADAQADVCLHRANMQSCRKCCVTAHTSLLTCFIWFPFTAHYEICSRNAYPIFSH